MNYLTNSDASLKCKQPHVEWNQVASGTKILTRRAAKYLQHAQLLRQDAVLGRNIAIGSLIAGLLLCVSLKAVYKPHPALLSSGRFRQLLPKHLPYLPLASTMPITAFWTLQWAKTDRKGLEESANRHQQLAVLEMKAKYARLGESGHITNLAPIAKNLEWSGFTKDQSEAIASQLQPKAPDSILIPSAPAPLRTTGLRKRTHINHDNRLNK